jgi:succinoglycan biosynthesis protein ExoM
VPEPIRVVVGVLTYQRPLKLREGLSRIVQQVRELDARTDLEVGVLVVDNDPAASAAPVVAAFADSSMRYVVEAEPGIAVARNRALDESADADLLVFIDDDEWPEPQWLSALITTWQRTGAAAVMGRVISRFEHEVSPWVAAGEFFWRPTMPSGTELKLAAAGNLLLDLRQVRRIGVRFDQRLALGGGEDTLFSRQLTGGGGRIVWCDESAAVDFVPASRTTRRWVLARAMSHGNASARVDLLLAVRPVDEWKTRVLAVTRGMARMAAGTSRFLAGLATGSYRHQARGMRAVYRGAGMALAAFGFAYQEYARKQSH